MKNSNDHTRYILSNSRKDKHREGKHSTKNTMHTKNKENHLTQKEMLQLLRPILKTKGKTYQKDKKIIARRGIKGEQIVTITSDGKETVNTVVDDNSFIVQNQTDAKEEYIVLGEKFEQKYDYLGGDTASNQLYLAKGKIKAVKLTSALWATLSFPAKQFYYEPAWGGNMVVKLYDYLACPLDYSEVYRIARKEFWETYKEIENWNG